MNIAKSDYLAISRASDLPTVASRLLYRTFEILPGTLAWFTILGIFAASRYAPVFATFFVIAFDIYWLLKTVFLSLHLRAGYAEMQRRLKVNWMEKLDQLKTENYNRKLETKNWRDIHHLIILPFYNEPYEVLRESIEAILGNTYPKDRMIVVLASEARAGEIATVTAERIEHEYGGHFLKFLVTRHPSDVPGELAGKGSNETYAARIAVKELIRPLGLRNEQVMVSSLDIDTVTPPQYFAILTHAYLTCERPLRSSFMPIPVYNNNIWKVPAFSRVVAVSGTFWQTMQQARPERLATFSSHSIPLSPLIEMDYWNVANVSEDSRIFWKAILAFDGDYRVVPLYYPVYMDASEGLTITQTAKNIYKQQRRWGWGVENVPYFLFGFFNNKKIPLRRRVYYSFIQLEGFWSWGTNAFIIFLLGWLPILIGSDVFNTTVLAYNLPRLTRGIMTLTMIGLVTSAYISMRLLPPRPKDKPMRIYVWMVLQWILLPITITVFGALPGLEAQTRLMLGRYMGFWVTPKYRSNSKTGETNVKVFT